MGTIVEQNSVNKCFLSDHMPNVIMHDAEYIVPHLKITRDTLVGFSTLVDNMVRSKEKYGVGFDDLRSVDLSEPESVNKLITSLSDKELGMLLMANAELATIQKKIQNFMILSEKELSELHDKLVSITAKLDRIIGE